MLTEAEVSQDLELRDCDVRAVYGERLLFLCRWLLPEQQQKFGHNGNEIMRFLRLGTGCSESISLTSIDGKSFVGYIYDNS